jgi:histidinol phosphatase-like enzyme
MRRALPVDLFSTVIPGGHAEQAEVHRQMAHILGVNPDTFATTFDATVDEAITATSPLPLREICAATPDPAIYLAACAGLGVDPTASVYVADGTDNELQATKSLGIHPIRTH